MKLGICSRKNTLCADCDSRTCAHAGDKGADCPKYSCDNEPKGDCAHCAYIDGYIRIMRNKIRHAS